MRISNGRDGLDLFCDAGVWTLYLVENGGRTLTAIGTIYDHHSAILLSEYLGHRAQHSRGRPANDNGSVNESVNTDIIPF